MENRYYVKIAIKKEYQIKNLATAKKFYPINR